MSTYQQSVKVLTTVVGSGPGGETTREAPFYTLDPHPAQLTLNKSVSQHSPAAARRDIDAGPGVLAFVIDNILTRQEADALAAVSESMGYSRFAPGIRTPPGMRRNLAAHWFASQETAAALLEPLMDRFSHLLPAEIDGTTLHRRLSHRMAHYKYNGALRQFEVLIIASPSGLCVRVSDGDVFQRHTDGCWPGQGITASGDGIEDWEGVESKLSMLLYLSDEQDGVQGGRTRLFPFDNNQPVVDVEPRKGSALFFRHGFGKDSVHHMGTTVSGDTAKYVVRLNVLYNQR